MAISKATASSIAPAAKGDLVAGTATNDAAVLGVGANNTVLTADSAEATGLKWATPASSVPANAGATVATAETTTSTSYTDLATSGPAVTVTTGTKALVIYTSEISNNTSNAYSNMSYAVSGATTIAALDTQSLFIRQTSSTTGQPFRASATSVVTLTAGSNTFTAKYRVNSGTATFQDRSIFVINLA